LQDCNIVIYYTPTGKPLWASNTNKPGAVNPCNGARLVMQTDGNLVAYDYFNVPVWSTRTGGKSSPGRKVVAVMQFDGNFVVYNGQQPIWSSGTAGKTA
jgi:hypothetical protein